MTKSNQKYFVYSSNIDNTFPIEGTIGTFEELTELFSDGWWETQECIEVVLGKKKIITYKIEDAPSSKKTSRKKHV